MEQQYKEIKVLRIHDSGGSKVSEKPSVYDCSDTASVLETYIKDGWHIISVTPAAGYATFTHSVVLGR